MRFIAVKTSGFSGSNAVYRHVAEWQAEKRWIRPIYRHDVLSTRRLPFWPSLTCSVYRPKSIYNTQSNHDIYYIYNMYINTQLFNTYMPPKSININGLWVSWIVLQTDVGVTACACVDITLWQTTIVVAHRNTRSPPNHNVHVGLIYACMTTWMHNMHACCHILCVCMTHIMCL